MVQRSVYVPPILAFDNPTRAQHEARTWILMSLRELPVDVLRMVAETPRKRYSPEHDQAARVMAEHMVMTISRHLVIAEKEDRHGHR